MPFWRSTPALPTLGWITGLLISTAAADIPCGSSNGPDVIVGQLTDAYNWGAVGDVGGYSLGTLACNIGNEVVLWEPLNSDHPAIVQNVYRLRNGRFEQIGMSWAKHGFFAETDNFCCTCQDPHNGARLGIGCSDVYSGHLNGNQAGFNGQSGLGPRSQINPSTGMFPFPYQSQGQSGDAIYKRIQIHQNDLDPALNPGAQYFGEGQYIAADDAAAHN